ncbi:LacI family DNA-binding transcriptional regulator [Pontivivens insulae]|uniref:HTH-type transcriptional repressor CytR n=1 Tax=Pontivivens insulae TaxID=1639689 RepID=A0A2R8A8Z3_9RHOB|nr:LacI family DNA-binding transcriptional regulator [Pontivivens insulae]RED18795.1 LacI family transcriptional regulator [Pontivivens insulae]SPF28693.1 HTH-type transcriptional repressor CytR [Pontivivens insulae]
MSEKVATAQDVARAAGVSTATVSRALSHPMKVSEATRARVAHAVQQTGYRVNRTARNLRTRRADSVLVLLPDLANPFFSGILEGIAQHLSTRGISMLVAGTRQMKNNGERLIDYFDDGRVDGLINLDGALGEETLKTLSNSPHGERIIYACEWTEDQAFPCVRTENFEGAAMAVRHFHELGHRAIGHVMGPADNVLTHARRDGVIAELSRLGLTAPDYWIIPGDFSLEAGVAAARAWLGMEERPTALFCASDIIAFGLISELTKRGFSVPKDVAVIGFDDIELAAHFIPPLTTIRQDRYEIGIAAARLLTDRLSPSVEDQPKLVTLPVSLVSRESC